MSVNLNPVLPKTELRVLRPTSAGKNLHFLTKVHVHVTVHKDLLNNGFGASRAAHLSLSFSLALRLAVLQYT